MKAVFTVDELSGGTVGVVSPVTKPMLSRATDPHLYLGVVTVGFTLTWSPTFTDVSSLLTGDTHTDRHIGR